MTQPTPRPGDADRNLLFGVLALQADVISRTQFIDACSAWAARKDTSLADVLAERGWLSAEDRADVERLVGRKLRKHAGDARSSLAEVAGEGASLSLADLATADSGNSLPDPGLTQDALPGVTQDGRPEMRGRYRLTRLHCRGGIGQVWLAHDAELGRDVALKELRPDRSRNPLVFARFLEEARITGRLEHPGIVPVYELAGQASNGSPFYTMRFIRGRTLSEATREYHRRRADGRAGPLELRELLGAFVSVCNAVAYAHSRGVIHRDLKGPNVVLGDFGEVMVLDWGLAKVLAPGLPSPVDGSLATAPRPAPATAAPAREAATLMALPGSTPPPSSRDLTVQGQILGTPAYMAPEQAEGRLQGIDARTDVYSLGTILYEILVGEPPFAGEDSTAVLRRVLHESPTPPSRRVPATPPALEAICLRALGKKPDERYPSAAALAQDVRAFLADEPVSAYAEPAPARLARWARRHRPAVSGAAALVATAVVALVVGVVLLGRANRQTQQQRDLAQAGHAEAEHQRRLAEQHLTQAQAAEKQARQAAATAQAINQFLVNDVLAEADPEKNPRAKKVTVEEALDRATARIGTALKDQPEVEASVRAEAGEVYYLLGQYAMAEPHLRRAMELRRRVLGPEHADTLDTINRLAELLWAEGRYADAAALGLPNLDATRRVLGPTHKRTLTALNNAGLFLHQEGQLARAEPLLRENLELRRQALGPEHGYTLNAANNMARLLLDQGKLREAEEKLRWAVTAGRRSLKPDDPLQVVFQINLAAVLTEEGATREAEPILRRMLEECARIHGAEHPRVLICRNNLNRLLEREGRLAEAETAGRQNLEACRRVFGKEHVRTLAATETLARVLLDEGKTAEAEPLLRTALAGRRKSLPPRHYETAHSLELLGLLLLRTGRAQESEPLLREAVQIRRDSLPSGHGLTAIVENHLGAALLELGRYAEAEPLLVPSSTTLANLPGTPPQALRDARQRVATLYTRWGKPDKAAAWKATAEQATRQK